MLSCLPLSEGLAQKRQQLTSIPLVGESAYDLDKTKVLGNGAFAKVYQATERTPFALIRFSRTKYKWAVKLVRYRTEEEVRNAEERYKAKAEEAALKYIEALREEGYSIEETGPDAKEKAYNIFLTKTAGGKEFLRPEDCLREINVLIHLQPKRASAKHIVNFKAAFELDRVVWIVTECMAGSLRSMLNIFGDDVRIPLQDVALICHEVLMALRYMQKRRVIHCDIKPSNILFSTTGRLKLCDFGISRVVPKGQSNVEVESVNGTTEYMSSERFYIGQKLDYSADLWSLGIVMYNLAHNGKSPFSGRKKTFHPKLWLSYAKSYLHYIEGIFGSMDLTLEERWRIRNTPPVLPSYVTPLKLMLRWCVVPYPKCGLKGEVSRSDMVSRVSLNEFVDWCKARMLETSELGQRQRLQKLIERYREI